MVSVYTIVGIDPDADKHGVALYSNGELSDLKQLQLQDLVNYLWQIADLVSIEDVMANQFVYARNRSGSTANQSKIAMHIGRCQQAQVELMRMLDSRKIPYVLHKPQKGNWADNRELFEKITGWDKQSNADTRSAAYFGYLALQANPRRV